MKNIKKILDDTKLLDKVEISKCISGTRGFTCDYYFKLDPSQINGRMVKDVLNIFRKELVHGFMLRVHYNIDCYKVYDNLELKWVERIIDKELNGFFSADKSMEEEFVITIDIDEQTVSFGFNDGSIDDGLIYKFNETEKENSHKAIRYEKALKTALETVVDKH